MRQKICDFHELDDLSSKEFTIKIGEKVKDAFLVKFNDHCYAFENSCPHTGVNLNWQAGQFFSFDGLYLQCSLHGALFEPDSGTCVRGPCINDRLQPIKIVREDDVVYLFE